MLMRAVILVLPLLAGCNADLCSLLLGTFSGAYDGDLSGSLDAILTADPKDDTQALADFTLGTDADPVHGTGHVTCEDGSLVLDLRDIDGLQLGKVLGDIQQGTGSGTYQMDDDANSSGTWEY